MKARIIAVLLSLSMLLALLPGNAAPGMAQNTGSQVMALPDEPAPAGDVTWQTAPDGRRYMPASTQRPDRSTRLAPQATGGPDEYGYAWNDAVPSSWIDAVAGGTDTGMSGDSWGQATGLIALPFAFKYYENTYTGVYIAASGYLGFTNYGDWPDQDEIPRPSIPNNVVAPYWTPTYLQSSGPSGRVYYKRGGVAPNRYFVAEWYDVKGGNPSDTIGRDETYRFEAILYENGTIDFGYKTMSYDANGSWWCGSIGIEDSMGLDGLAYIYFCDQAPSNKTIRFTRPAPSARVSLSPTGNGAFSSPGAIVQLSETIRNTGDVGTDTYDLFPTSSWPMALYSSDGVTPLTDTDGDGAIDTDAMAQGSSRTIVVKMTVPYDAVIGQSNSGRLLVRSSLNLSKSKTTPLQVAVPAMFAQGYTQNYRPYAGFYRPTGQAIRQTSNNSSYGPAVATTPDGNVVQVWYQYRTNNNGKYVAELYYALLDRYGNILRPAARITDNSTTTTDTYDRYPAVAIAPDGSIGIVWYRYLYNSSNSTTNYNIYYKVLNSVGGTVTIANLTNNSLWGSGFMINVPRFYETTIAATSNNRFVMAWHKYLYNGSSSANTIWYAVRNTAGGSVKPVTSFSADTCSRYPNLTPLADGSVFLTVLTCGQVSMGRLDSAGHILTGLTPFTTDSGNYYSDAIQLPNGHIVLVWTHWNGTRYDIRYAVLNSGLGTIRGSTNLASMSPIGDMYPSATYSGNRAMITWGNECCGYQPNLYYALLDGVGNLLTPPMIFANDNTDYSLQLPYNGQGNTYLPGADDVTPPTNPTNLSSTDHTVNVWSNDNTIAVTWSGAADTGGSGLDGYSVLWDTFAASVPDASKDLEETATSTTSPALPDGNWYFHIRAIDNAGNAAAGAAHLGPFKIETIAPKSSAYSPEFSTGPFTVQWFGTDTGSGIGNYNIWMRDTAGGAWTQWLNNTTATSATYAGGVTGHTYYFRSEARDVAGNLETDLPFDGDTHTTIATYQVTGTVLNNQHQPIFNATVIADPSALHAAATEGNGQYTLYFDTAGAYSLAANRDGFGPLPPQVNLSFSGNATVSEFILPPSNEAVTNGSWEIGDLTGWTSDATFTPTVTLTAAHTGQYGLRLNTTTAKLAAMPAMTQTIPISGAQPILSFMYRVTQGSGDPFVVAINGDTGTITRSIALTPIDWAHDWIDLTAFSGQTITLTFGFENPAATQQIDLDEISIGDPLRGVYPIYLPLIRRS